MKEFVRKQLVHWLESERTTKKIWESFWISFGPSKTIEPWFMV